MAAVATENWQHPSHFQNSRPRFQYASPQPQSLPPDMPPPPRNEKELTRESLLTILTYFSTLIPSHFNGYPVRLVVHGGACMLLHPGLYGLAQQLHLPSSSSDPLYKSLPRRTSTRDVDYIHRSFAAEWHALGITDATERLQDCIKTTARHFGLGADWMNSDADVALPMAKDVSGKTYDPIYKASIQPNNVHLHTIFASPDGMLTLVSVTPFWAVALKLVRYTRYDPGDICLLLRNGTNLTKIQWTTQLLEAWLFEQCWPMGYSSYDVIRLKELKSRVHHAVQMVSSWDSAIGSQGLMMPTEPTNGGGRGSWGNQHRTQHLHPPAQHVDARLNHSSHAPPSHASLIPVAQGHVANHDLDDQWLDPPPRIKSRRPSPNQSPWHAKPEPHIQQFDRSIATMLHDGRAMPPRVLESMNPAMVEQTSRRSRDKHRARDRKRDRLSKLFTRNRDEPGSDTDSEDDHEFLHHRRHPSLQAEKYYQQQQQQQQQRQQISEQENPRLPSWHIYAQPTNAQTRLSTPHHSDRRGRSLSPAPIPTKRENSRRRPPPLELSPITNLESLTDSLAIF